jgi:hypothetical protein
MEQLYVDQKLAHFLVQSGLHGRQLPLQSCERASDAFVTWLPSAQIFLER